MSTETKTLRLEVRYNTSKELLACALCAYFFEPLPVVGILHDGDQSIGHLCPYCFLDPQDAAVRLRERIEVKRVRPQDLKSESAPLLEWESAQQRGDCLEDLAERIEELHSWPQTSGD